MARADGESILDEKLDVAGAFAMGAGHVNPSTKPVDPGLAYIDEAAYICGRGYTNEQVQIIITRESDACRRARRKVTGVELNYTSVVARASAGKITERSSVDAAQSKYRVEVSAPNFVPVKGMFGYSGCVWLEG